MATESQKWSSHHLEHGDLVGQNIMIRLDENKNVLRLTFIDFGNIRHET